MLILEDSCVYLGDRLDTEGIHPTTDKLIALQNAPEPTSVAELLLMRIPNT